MTALTEATPTTRTASAAAKTLRRSASRPRSHADGMAVASFILGLLGTLVLNLVLGPCALILGGLALARGTDRRGRALLGIALGAADLLLLALLVTTDGTVSWHIGS
ncbi:hypothetical protein ACTPOK_25435 [Streptomyces inhibens]|uniref:hypothetical protein n=1 Tax=Streptomyces inhibens TaxID=2293571 RepID=UPI00402ACBDA